MYDDLGEWADLDEYYPQYYSSQFVTCFSSYQLPIYNAAVAEFAVSHPDHSFVIDNSGDWNAGKDPALLSFDRAELREFWPIFEKHRSDFIQQQWEQL